MIVKIAGDFELELWRDNQGCARIKRLSTAASRLIVVLTFHWQARRVAK